MDATTSIVSLLALRAGACEKRSVDEVAIDITAESERLLRERDWDDDLLPTARRASHLADSALSHSAAVVSRGEARNGHAGQQVQNPGQAAGDSVQGPKSGWDWAMFWGPAERRLIAGAVVVDELRSAVFAELGFSCSGGVAQTKLLAKLGCGLHKPRQQTIIMPDAVAALLRDLPLDRMPGLGGDLGSQVKAALNVATCSELAAVPEKVIEAAFPKMGSHLLELAEGRFSEPVQDRELSKSLSNGKTFPGHFALKSVGQCERWLKELAGELHQRYIEDSASNMRAPTSISISIGVGGNGGVNASRQGSIDLGRKGTKDRIVSAALACLRRWLPKGRDTGHGLAVTSLGMSLSGMKPLEASSSSLRDLFSRPMEKAVAEASSKSSGPLARCFATSSAGGPLAVPAAKMQSEPKNTAMPEAVAIEIDSDDDQLSVAIENSWVPQDVDPAVLAALPADIRAEILASTRQEATPTAGKRSRDFAEVQAAGVRVKRLNLGGGQTGGTANFFQPVPGSVADAGA